MDHRRSGALVVSCALVAAAPAVADQRLDLDVDPAQVEATQPPPHDLVIPSPGARSAIEPDEAAPGWSLRPTADVDVGSDGGERAGAGADERALDLGDVTLDLNSLGLRLERTW